MILLAELNNESSPVSELEIVIENNMVTRARVCMHIQPVYTPACKGIPFPVSSGWMHFGLVGYSTVAKKEVRV